MIRQTKGFSLIELLVVVGIIMLVLGAAFETYLSMFKKSLPEQQKASAQAETSIDIQLLVTDIKNAGFAMPKEAAVASKNNLTQAEAKVWQQISNSDWNKYSHLEGTDRLYLADATQIFEDFSDDCTEVGNISLNDYARIVMSKLQGSVGFHAKLTADAQEGDSSISVDTPDIDGNANQCECTGACTAKTSCDATTRKDKDCDFRANKAVIIVDTNAKQIEGRRVSGQHDKTSTTIEFKSGETLEHDYSKNSSYVVPAICYWLGVPTENSPFYGQPQVFTLYRNSDPYIDGVEDFQVQYGYDKDGNGALEWYDEIDLNYSLQAIWIGLVIRLPHRQRQIVDNREQIELYDPGQNQVHQYELTDEMKHYYRRIYTITIHPRNIHAVD